jgi:hypothetical protein
MKDKAAYICPICRECDKKKITHPGVRHIPGICDCHCRPMDETQIEYENYLDRSGKREKT